MNWWIWWTSKCNINSIVFKVLWLILKLWIPARLENSVKEYCGNIALATKRLIENAAMRFWHVESCKNNALISDLYFCTSKVAKIKTEMNLLHLSFTRLWFNLEIQQSKQTKLTPRRIMLLYEGDQWYFPCYRKLTRKNRATHKVSAK